MTQSHVSSQFTWLRREYILEDPQPIFLIRFVGGEAATDSGGHDGPQDAGHRVSRTATSPVRVGEIRRTVRPLELDLRILEVGFRREGWQAIDRGRLAVLRPAAPKVLLAREGGTVEVPAEVVGGAR